MAQDDSNGRTGSGAMRKLIGHAKEAKPGTQKLDKQEGGRALKDRGVRPFEGGWRGMGDGAPVGQGGEAFVQGLIERMKSLQVKPDPSIPVSHYFPQEAHPGGKAGPTREEAQVAVDRNKWMADNWQVDPNGPQVDPRTGWQTSSEPGRRAPKGRPFQVLVPPVRRPSGRPWGGPNPTPSTQSLPYTPGGERPAPAAKPVTPTRPSGLTG